MLADPLAVEGDWLVALRQDGGRGRQGRSWQSIDGNFHGSTLVELRHGDPPAPALALVAGLALIEAAEVAAPGSQLCLKWPNDLMLGDAKLAGVLLERTGERVVVGFGVNLAAAPAIAGRQTGALSSVRMVTPQEFAPVLADRFARLLVSWRGSGPDRFAAAWMARAHPVGTALEVHGGPNERLTGIFEGIEADGALRLRQSDGAVRLVRAGDIYLR